MTKETATLHIGVIGCGYWGSKHVRVLSSLPGVEVSLIDGDRSRRRVLEGAFPIEKSVSSLADVNGDLDAVVVSTPPRSHYRLAREAMERGLHVLVEKPLTTSGYEAEHLIVIAAERDLRLMVGHTFEFNPAVWKLKEVVHRADFGRIRYINSERLNLGLYQVDVDVLWDLAPHDVSILNFLLEDRPVAVSAWGLNLMAPHPDVAYLALRYGRTEVSANVRVSWLDPVKVRRTTVVGESRMVVYDDVAADERIRVYDKGVETGRVAQGEGGGYPLTYRHGDIFSPYVDFEEPLQVELSAFVAAIRDGVVVNGQGRVGADVVRVLCAAEESRLRGTWVEVDYGTEGDVEDESGQAETVAAVVR